MQETSLENVWNIYGTTFFIDTHSPVTFKHHAHVNLMRFLDLSFSFLQNFLFKEIFSLSCLPIFNIGSN